MTTLYYYHDDFLQHDTGPGHPECAARLTHINAELAGADFASLVKVTPTLKENIRDHIQRLHSPALIEKIFAMIPEQGHAYLDQDTVLSPGSGRAALLAASSVCDAVDRVLTGQADNAFCAVRPPGHHAEAERAMGFCLFNNIAIAATYARRQYDLQRVAIVDFDVHHGNGTQQAFYQQAEVLYASTHQMPHYPGSGHPSETGVGNIVNVPLAAGDGGPQFRQKYRDIILPALKLFKPQLMLLSAGFDAHKDDPLASIMLEADDYAWLTRQLVEIAERECSGHIVSILEGGYNLAALQESVGAHIKALMNS
ncbi:histone deacetylase family protein [Methylomarinum sp. Ch1-1]|uniref:Histone deacetylase family protein n=1 Tax=Methylomarinum roseum TaxID=3067653 RepID=A0AAU7NSR1_9GAMM|nr:histone deacetylase family protein [Methylomarinum sp. Ch1-1]MDP4519991.1 histone deacetylase family protein [Methylomarinum sp. Ch1-1]